MIDLRVKEINWHPEEVIDIVFICDECKQYLLQRVDKDSYGEHWLSAVETCKQYLTYKAQEHKCEKVGE